jgi:hypothetical protein
MEEIMKNEDSTYTQLVDLINPTHLISAKE